MCLLQRDFCCAADAAVRRRRLHEQVAGRLIDGVLYAETQRILERARRWSLLFRNLPRTDIWISSFSESDQNLG
ncbi:hypothetical protein HCTV5_1 [Halovirus HCTV-5]|uniref:hypothetical protein n=1 Tax=Halovirus HCTV-5 TaxID=1273748 RepID=UPI0003348D96|nr:hypothetical protein M200_gp001 [Halovirus HCTV-5]AGM11612.1 hypothetical protein HCTV5_1 [Halovirus HCTV-5]